MQKIALALLSSTFLSVCLATTNPIKTNPNEMYSSFNSSESIVVYSSMLGCTNNNLTCSSLGFEWNEQDPENSYTLISIDEHPKHAKQQNILEVKFDIEGDVFVVKPISTNSNVDISSNYQITSQLYLVPMSLLKYVIKSDNSRVQIRTMNAVFDIDFEHIHRTHLMRFLKQVDAAKEANTLNKD